MENTMENRQKTEENGVWDACRAAGGTLEAEIRALLGDVEPRDTGFAAKLRFPADFCGFRGHFPDNPVLPGVAQIMVLRCLLEKGLGGPVFMLEVPQAKFLLPVGPDVDMSVSLERDRKEDGRWNGLVETKEGVAARVVLTTEGDHAR